MPGAENVAEGQRCSMTQEARGFSKGLGLCEVLRAAVRRRFGWVSRSSTESTRCIDSDHRVFPVKSKDHVTERYLSNTFCEITRPAWFYATIT